MPSTSRVRLTVQEDGTVLAQNESGASVVIASDGPNTFTPVELLAAALGGCAGMDFASLMGKQRSPVTPLAMEVVAEEGTDGDERVTAARVAYLVASQGATEAQIERARRLTADELCTVSRTLTHGCPVDHVVERPPNATA